MTAGQAMPVAFEAEFDRLDTALDQLGAKIDACLQAIVLCRVAITLGLGTLAVVLTIMPAYASATVVLSAITASLGGTVWLGASKSSLEELRAGQSAVEAQKNALFDAVAARNGWHPGTIQ